MRNQKIGALLVKAESSYQIAQKFLRTRDEDAAENGEDLMVRMLRKGANGFATAAVFAGDKHGIKPAMERVLQAYMLISSVEAHRLATWYAVKAAEAGDEGMAALVKAARLVTTNPARQAWALMGDEATGIESRGDAAIRLLREIVRVNRTNALIADETNRLRVAADAKMNEVAFLLIDAGLFGGVKAADGSNPDAEQIAAEIVNAGLATEQPAAAEEEGVEVEVAPVATETEVLTEPVVEEPAPKKESNKARKAKEAKEAAAAKDPTAGLTGKKPAKVVVNGLAGLEGVTGK